MSDSFYEMRKKLQERKLKVEREYSESATGFVNEMLDRPANAVLGGIQEGLGGFASGLTGEKRYEVTDRDYRIPKNSVTGVNMSDPTQPIPDNVIPKETVNFVGRELANPLNYASGRMFSQFAARIPENVTTLINDFYSGDPRKRLKGLFEAGIESVPDSLLEIFSPTAMATASKYGTGGRRRLEQIAPGDGKPSTRQGNMAASPFLRAQSENRLPTGDTIVESMPTYRQEVKEAITMEDTAAVKKALASDNPEIPKEVVDRAFNHLQEAQNQTVGSLVVRNRSAVGSDLGKEASGSASTASPAARFLQSPRAMSSFAEFAGENLTKENMTELIKATSAFASDKLRDPRVVKNLPAGVKDEGKVVASALWGNYWKAKAAKNPTVQQKKVIETVDGIRAKTPVRVNEMDGMLVFSQSFKSSAKDLGGMNVFIVADPSTKTFYTMLSDGHDLFGSVPPGWNQLSNVLPIQKHTIGGGQSNRPRGSQEQIDNAKTIRRDVGMLEEASGIPRNKNESVKAYEDRVARDFRAKPELKDRISAGSNQVGLFNALFKEPNEQDQ